MNDFLRNLRTSHKKETPHSKKNLDGNFHPQNDRRNIRDRRTINLSEPKGNLPRQWGDLLPEILENTTVLTEQAVKLTENNELIIEAKIRQHNAVADFFNALSKMISESSKTAVPGTSPPKATASYASGTHYTKDDILTIIRNMRKQGTTYGIIADYLKEKGIPTFSNRGEWHAQTIHRLCK